MARYLRSWTGSLRRSALALATTVVALVLTGCAGRMVSGQIEKGIEAKLPELIGPAKSYDVNVDGSAQKMIKGKIRQIDIHGTDVIVPPGLVVNSLDVQLTDVIADTKKGELKSIGGATFAAEVTEDSLNRYLAENRSDKMRAQMLDGRMVVQAEPEVLGLSVGVKVTGHLVPKGSKLDYRVDRLQVIGINTPQVAARMVEDEVNPVIDLANPPFAPVVKTVEIKPGVVRIAGTAALDR
jgi:hypothetical protein